MLSRNQVLLGFEDRRLLRGPSTGPERWLLQWPERLQLPELRRPQERGPYKGQGLPQPSRGRGNPDNAEVRMQIPEFRDQTSECRTPETHDLAFLASLAVNGWRIAAVGALEREV